MRGRHRGRVSRSRRVARCTPPPSLPPPRPPVNHSAPASSGPPLLRYDVAMWHSKVNALTKRVESCYVLGRRGKKKKGGGGGGKCFRWNRAHVKVACCDDGMWFNPATAAEGLPGRCSITKKNNNNERIWKKIFLRWSWLCLILMWMMEDSLWVAFDPNEGLSHSSLGIFL